MKRKPYITLRDRWLKGKPWFSGLQIRMLTDEEAIGLDNIKCIIKHYENLNCWPETVEGCKRIFKGTYIGLPIKKNSYTWGLKGISKFDFGTELEALWALLDYCKICKLLK